MTCVIEHLEYIDGKGPAFQNIKTTNVHNLRNTNDLLLTFMRKYRNTLTQIHISED